MVEYALLLAANSGAHWFERVRNTAVDDPVVLWAGGAALVLLMMSLLRPGR